jgi:hypothetical protein
LRLGGNGRRFHQVNKGTREIGRYHGFKLSFIHGNIIGTIIFSWGLVSTDPQSVTVDGLNESKEVHGVIHIFYESFDDHGIIDMGEGTFLTGAHEISRGNGSIIVREFVVIEVVVDLSNGQELQGLQEGHLTGPESLGEDQGSHEDVLFFRGTDHSGAGGGDGHRAKQFVLKINKRKNYN